MPRFLLHLRGLPARFAFYQGTPSARAASVTLEGGGQAGMGESKFGLVALPGEHHRLFSELPHSGYEASELAFEGLDNAIAPALGDGMRSECAAFS